MAEKTTIVEREYIIPLRNSWLKVEYYKRAGKAIKTIKQFIAKHMKVQDRDVSKVKLDIYLNQEIMHRGRKQPPSKIKVKARKEGDIVRVELAEMPSALKFAKSKHERRHQKAEIKAPVEKVEKKTEDKEAKASDEEKKKAESEKEQAVAEQRALEAKMDSTAMKHTTSIKETQGRQKTSKGFSR